MFLVNARGAIFLLPALAVFLNNRPAATKAAEENPLSARR